MPAPFRKTLLALLLGSLGATASAAPGTVAFVGGRVIDGTGAPAIENAVLVSTDGRIVAVGPAASTPIPDGAQRVDVSGKTLIPGLINAHGHVGDVLGLETGHYDRGNVLRQLDLYARYGVTMIAIHRANMKPNTPAEQRLLRTHRKRIETCNSQLEKMGVARLHARLTAGVSLKIAASLCALSVTNYC